MLPSPAGRVGTLLGQVIIHIAPTFSINFWHLQAVFLTLCCKLCSCASAGVPGTTASGSRANQPGSGAQKSVAGAARPGPSKLSAAPKPGSSRPQPGSLANGAVKPAAVHSDSESVSNTASYSTGCTQWNSKRCPCLPNPGVLCAQYWLQLSGHKRLVQHVRMCMLGVGGLQQI